MNITDIFRSQYHAALSMLRQSISQCPPAIWDDPNDHNKFWHMAYHALFYTHLYLSTSDGEFKPWVMHREDYQFMGPISATLIREKICKFISMSVGSSWTPKSQHSILMLLLVLRGYHTKKWSC